ncbi:MAG: hypothetical protein FWB86_04510 [Treponema sp.]|nr:hypothetical protein [Treponema sp.]MCL2251514.1 hypothetical protein [Treponema sp.]
MKKNIFFLLLPIFIFFTCGIPEYYFLEQVPEGQRTMTSGATITLYTPSYYADGYRIYYKIYLSDNNQESSVEAANERIFINSTLNTDFNFFDPYTDPNRYDKILGENTFKDQKYHALELYNADINSLLGNIPSQGLTLDFFFPVTLGLDNFPYLILNNSSPYLLWRSSNELITPKPDDDLSFRRSDELSFNEYAVSTINPDVTPNNQASSVASYAYVSMYIVAIGSNPVSFGTLYSKPTFISIFKLPEAN